MKWIHRLKAVYYHLFGKRYVAEICGHKTTNYVRVVAAGKETFLSFGKQCPPYCAKCVASQAIRCAWCGGVIMPGDPITLYSPKKENFQAPDYAVRYKKEPLRFVGCLRSDCADSGVDRSGFWVSPGRVHRVLSPIEMVLAMGGEDVVICNDLSDMSRAITIEEEGE